MENRLHIDPVTLDFLVLPESIKYGEQLYGDLDTIKSSRKGEINARADSRVKGPKRAKGTRLRDTDPW